MRKLATKLLLLIGFVDGPSFEIGVYGASNEGRGVTGDTMATSNTEMDGGGVLDRF